MLASRTPSGHHGKVSRGDLRIVKNRIMETSNEIKQEFLSILNSIGCKHCTINNNLHVGGSLDLEGTSITSLPDGLHVGGYLDLEGTSITSLLDGRPIINVDMNAMSVDSSREVNGYTIYLCTYIGMKSLGDARGARKRFVAKKKGFTAHGLSLKEAVEDCRFKIMQESADCSQIIKEIQSTGFVSLAQYRLITGACKVGCLDFLRTRNISSLEMPLAEVKKLVHGQFGGDTFLKMLENN